MLQATCGLKTTLIKSAALLRAEVRVFRRTMRKHGS